MNRASASDMRKALDMVQALSQAGILFVPMLVANADEANHRIIEAQARLEQMAQADEAK